MKFAWRALLLLMLSLTPSLAQAASIDEISALYVRGDYEQAARLGEASHTAPGLAMAARAVLAEEVLGDVPCLLCLQRAEKLSREAIAADPHFALAQVWLAVALGYESRILGPIRARLKDTPNQSKAALLLACQAEPGNAFAISALGGWNIEVVRAGGSFLARHIYGATETEGLSLFDQAVKADPKNVAVHYQIALSLAGFDAGKYRARIAAEFQSALSGTPNTEYEKKIQGRAGELLGLLGQGAVFDKRVRKYQGFPD